MWLGSCMVMWPWICETETRNAFPYSDGTHTRWKDCPCFACLFIRMFMVFWRQSTLYKVVNQAANSVNSDLPAFSSVQATSLWRVLYHRRAKSLFRKLRNEGAKVRSVILTLPIYSCLLINRRFLTTSPRVESVIKAVSNKQYHRTKWLHKSCC